MTDTILMFASLSLALVAALVAGVFQSFSDFVMRGLATAPAEGGMASMQRINVTVFRSWFLAGFFVLVPATLGLAIYAFAELDGAIALALVAAAVIYLPGSLGVTMLGNVPMNNRLASLPATDVTAQDYWHHYARVWTRYNHVRMFACVATAGCYLYAAVLLAGAAA